MYLGFNTNGLAFHDPLDGLALLADIGYRSVAITIDHQWLNPFADGFDSQLSVFRTLLERHQMRSVIETGARFLLDPRRKHEPTLLSSDPSDRARRIDFLCRCIDIADELDSECVSLWSGQAPDGCSTQEALDRLADSLEKVISRAEDRSVILGFEPEPGMCIDTTGGFQRLLQWIDAPCLQLTLDIGHLYCQGEVPIVDYIQRWKQRVINIHIEDMRAGVHEHLMFGDGEIHFPPIIEALSEINYQYGIHVELSRHSHDAVNAAQKSFEFLSDLIKSHSQK